MHDAAQANGQTYRTLTVGGRDYRIYDLSCRDLGSLQEFIDRQFPDPIRTILPHLGSLPVEVAKFAVREAQQMAARPKPQLGLAEADILLATVAGMLETAYLGIAKGDPSFTRADWQALLPAITPDMLTGARVHEATGLFRRPTDPPRDDADAAGPKA